MFISFGQLKKDRRFSRRGFTLVELLVTITIFVILTGVVLFSQNRFNSSILLTNLAYDTALTLRQAQTYGINIKNFNGTDNGFVPYGVHFALSNNKSFILFADTSYVDTANPGDGLYDVSNINPPVVLSICQTAQGCVNRYNITRGNYISGLCVNETESDDGDCTVNKLDIVFQRPNADALIRRDDVPTLINDATIKLTGVDGSVRKVKIKSNGLIQITH